MRRLARVQELRNIVREIHKSYFLILVMMSKTQIHSYFTNMYMRNMLPLGYSLNALEWVMIFWAYVLSNHFLISAISVSGECFAPFRASHRCRKWLSLKLMKTDDADPEIWWRIDVASWQIWQWTAFEAIRRGQKDVSDAKSVCSRTRVKDNDSMSLICFLPEAKLKE